jgi:hypothetical protein
MVRAAPARSWDVSGPGKPARRGAPGLVATAAPRAAAVRPPVGSQLGQVVTVPGGSDHDVPRLPASSDDSDAEHSVPQRSSSGSPSPDRGTLRALRRSPSSSDTSTDGRPVEGDNRGSGGGGETVHAFGIPASGSREHEMVFPELR